MVNLITPLPDVEWLQSHAYSVFKELNLGPVEIEVMRSDDDAVVMVVLPKQTDDKGAVAISSFRFKNGFGIRDSIKRAYWQAARELEHKIEKKKHSRPTVRRLN